MKAQYESRDMLDMQAIKTRQILRCTKRKILNVIPH